LEIKRLRKELAQAELERDILKKAAADFAKETLQVKPPAVAAYLLVYLLLSSLKCYHLCLC
jgi:transposase-like protein